MLCIIRISTAQPYFYGGLRFLALVNYLKNDGKKVYIFSSKDSISHELKTGGDGYFDLRNINELWGKSLKHRENDYKTKKPPSIKGVALGCITLTVLQNHKTNKVYAIV